jgi:hypothetical protein
VATTSRDATLWVPDQLEIRECPILAISDDGGLVKIKMGGVFGSTSNICTAAKTAGAAKIFATGTNRDA